MIAPDRPPRWRRALARVSRWWPGWARTPGARAALVLVVVALATAGAIRWGGPGAAGSLGLAALSLVIPRLLVWLVRSGARRSELAERLSRMAPRDTPPSEESLGLPESETAEVGEVMDDGLPDLERALEAGPDLTEARVGGSGAAGQRRRGRRASRPAGPPSIGKPSRRVVNTGFATLSRPAEPLPPFRKLQWGRRYVFWLNVGPPVESSIELTPVPLPVEQLPRGAELAVVLFGFPGGVQVAAGSDVGRIVLQPDGSARVSCQPCGRRLRGLSAADRSRRVDPVGTVDPASTLFFPVKAPWRLGKAKLRCNIYHDQLLVQSRLITVRLGLWPADDCALQSELEYSLSSSLAPAQLTAIASHRLSVMLNDDGEGGEGRSGTHQLRFYGRDGFKADTRITNLVLEDILRQSRQVLRRVAWGTAEEWQNQPYRYAGAVDDGMLAADLISLARTGYRIYATLLPDLAESSNRPLPKIAEMMATPGLIQFASKYEVREYLPAALIYDHPLDTASRSLALCPKLKESLAARLDLAATPCFNGGCPSRGDLDIVCPGGFWGFRHELSLPLSASEDASPFLHGSLHPSFAMAISTTLALAEDHQRDLQKLTSYGAWSVEASRKTTLALLGRQGHDVVYFYCHGGFDGAVPFIQVGPAGELGITSDNLLPYQIIWDRPGPLVFINGCRTGALQPAVAFDLVTSFVKLAKASGVIGTEITVFEPLACRFAESFFRAFLVEGQSVAAAVRRARLALLGERNPLGLVYVPFVLGTLKLAPSPN